ncbi:MAG TPA: hypothetical protein VGS23_04315 [Thermoplasmata archaeon]|nr:hypothetical protein [Thermoplasmata archaeon]
MATPDELDPECEIVRALAYILGPRSGDAALLDRCRGRVRPVTVRGGQDTPSVVSWIPTAGPFATFTLCQVHRRAPAIRGAVFAPEKG